MPSGPSEVGGDHGLKEGEVVCGEGTNPVKKAFIPHRNDILFLKKSLSRNFLHGLQSVVNSYGVGGGTDTHGHPPHTGLNKVWKHLVERFSKRI